MRQVVWQPAVGLFLAAAALNAVESPPVLEIRDYATAPVTGTPGGTGQTDGMLARINMLREEPGGSSRLFLADLNGPLYILDKKTRTLSTYLDFNGREERSGLFEKFMFETGWGNGLSSFQFDPDYQRNGRFYTVHIENPALAGSSVPDTARLRGLDVTGYTVTKAIETPGPVVNEAVLIEWTDTAQRNSTFEGVAREVLRVQMNTRIHPMGEVNFNPLARRGDPDWRVMYIGCGDSGSGEQRTSIRSNPQRLDTLVGKILRIIPDPAEHAGASTVSENGRYRIPRDNPFVATPGARSEIWAYGLRNPYRLEWAVDPDNTRNTRLIATSVGLRTWETVNIIHKGANYGYSLREGNELLLEDNTTALLPQIDRIPVQTGDRPGQDMVVPTYPVAQYAHAPGGGDAIGSGYLYRGKAIPALRGKYLFTDVSTGRVWYANYSEMLAADDGRPHTLAALHEVKLRWDDPADRPDAGARMYDTLYPIVETAYHARGGPDPDLPGRARISGAGRADGRFAVDAAGELYIISKSDGVVRRVVSASGF